MIGSACILLTGAHLLLAASNQPPLFLGVPVPAVIPSTNPPTPAPNQPIATNILAFDAESKEVSLKTGEQKAHFVFYVTNVSSSEVVIKALRPSCGCTVAKTPQTPLRLSPGEGTQITAEVAVYWSGTLSKILAVDTSAGSKQLVLKATSAPTPPNPARPPRDPLSCTPAERYNNLQLAKTERQLALRGECAECHVHPAVGKHGKELFVSACAICHMPEDRSPLVYDLQSRKRPMPRDYWKLFIDYGKPGTLMPAFTKEHSGFLTPEQVTSLLDYLTREFPKEGKLVYQDWVKMQRAMNGATTAAFTNVPPPSPAFPVDSKPK